MLDELKNKIQKYLLDRAQARYEKEIFRQTEPYEQWIALHEKNLKQNNDGKMGITTVNFNECGSDFDVMKLPGEIIIFMDDCGTLSPNAKSRIIEVFTDAMKIQNLSPEAFADVDETEILQPGFVYADEDYYQNTYGKRSKPWFKPVWSPDTLLSYFYIGSMFAVKKEDIVRLEWAKSENAFENVYDMVLKLTETLKTEGIIHLDEVLFHNYYKSQEGFDFDEWIPGAGKEFNKIREEALKRRNQTGVVSDLGVVYYQSKPQPMVSILIPSRNNPELLKKCLESIKNNTSYKKYEILVIDNGSSGENRLRIQQLTKEYGFRHLYQMMEFNFSAMCNYGVEHANGEYILLLNDDCEVIQSDWLEIMLGQAMLPHVGAVGAKLLYPDNNLIQHAGITNLEIGPAHKLIAMPDDQIYYHGINRMVHDMIGVTAACLMVSKKKYLEAGGFCDEMKVAYNDVDFCFALHEKGYYNVCRNDVILYHHESLTRGNDGDDLDKWMRLLAEKTYLYQRHSELKGKDPFYSKHLVTNAREYRCNFLYEYERTDYFASLALCEKPLIMEENESLIVSLEHATEEKKIDTNQQKGYLIEGWCYVKGIDNARYEKKLYLRNEQNQIWEVQLLSRYRKDVEETFPDEIHTGLSGFVCRIACQPEETKKSLAQGNYQILIAMKDTCSRQCLYHVAEQILEVK